RYRGIHSADIPDVTDASGATIRIVAGVAYGVTGPVRDVVTQPEYLDVTVPAGQTFTRATPRGHTVFAYVIAGKAVFNHQDDPYTYEAEGDSYFDQERDGLIGDRHLVLFADGDAVVVTAAGDGLRFLLISGKPIGESIAWRGPIVMNTQQELRVAFDELDQGTFIKHARRTRP
ncbi:MAG: pirin-like C-terminal cupin domain-containing protein, partial [Polyangiaceae bacterium]